MDPYDEWRGDRWYSAGRYWQPDPRWQEPQPWHAYGPVSGEPSPFQQEISLLQTAAIPRSVGPIETVTYNVRAGAQQWSYEFQRVAVPAVPTSGAMLSNGSICGG